MESELSEGQVLLSERIRSIERSIAFTEKRLREERETVLSDYNGREAREMPRHLCSLQTALWKDHKIYLWSRVLELSKVGHRHHNTAETALDFISYNSFASVKNGVALANNAIADAVAVRRRLGPQIRKVVAAQRAVRADQICSQTRFYMRNRRLWVANLHAEENRRTDEQRESAKQRDRDLVKDVRGSMDKSRFMSKRRMDSILSKFEEDQGTAGGLERWIRNIVTIPAQNPNCLPPACHGGPVHIEDPLAYHYNDRIINPWVQAERLLFLELFLIHGRDFRKIATYFEHKSVQDCVRFYYDIKMRLNLKYLVEGEAAHELRNKNSLVWLSRLPQESRSIAGNFSDPSVLSLPLECDE